MTERTGRRLSAEARRAQLIEIGTRHVEASSFDELSTDAVAEDAGISRGLLFHYFPTREDFVHAIAEEAARDLLERTEPDPDAPVREQWRSGLERYIDFVEAYPDGYISLIRGAVGRSEQIQQVVDRTRDVFAERILQGFGLDLDDAPAHLRYLARAYLSFIEEVVIQWVTDERAGRDDRLDRQAVVELCEGVAVGFASAAGLDEPAATEA